MKHIKFNFLIALTVMCGFNAGFSQNNDRALDSFLNLLQSEEKLMGAVTLAQGDDIVYTWAGGTAYHLGEEVRPQGPDKIFSIGSATKMFTSVAILQLVEKGVLSLETSLEEYFPQIEGADQIKLKHLLRHQSGIFNFTSDPDFKYWKHQDKTKSEILELLSGYDLEFPAGTHTAYSNSNYLLLGYIAEMVTYKDFNHLLDEKIFTPLGMTSTYMAGEDVPNSQRSHSFIKTDDDWITYIPETNRKVAHSAGGAYSNGRDLSVFMNALFNGQLIGPNSLKLMTDIEDGFGMGLLSVTFNGLQGYGHFGAIDEYNSAVVYFPETKTSIHLLTNGLNYSFQELIQQVFKLSFGEEIDWPDFSHTAVNETQLQNLTGIFFNSDSTESIEVSVEYGHLRIKSAEGAALFPRALDTVYFIDPIRGTQFKFISGEKGIVGIMMIKNTNQAVKFHRVGDRA